MDNFFNNQIGNFTVGRIIDINKQNRSFTTICCNDFSSRIRFNVPGNARIFGIFGQPINFNQLNVGMRVRVRHADFMTMSIPPQTTAFEINVIR